MNVASTSSHLPKTYNCCKYREVRKRVSMQSFEVWGASPTGASARADHGGSSKYSSWSLEDCEEWRSVPCERQFYMISRS
ncbi:hypothetical protein TNIN_61881 [Trichonephila inaurata madagascariensis]|uniref:Uncharacterized protein n=1 Tax=Trichonephila inaurata madagascariensis TaxID=2747483 RepID=A0A8X7BPC1_9ARAC|nr:hypothetical protein TNIN_61881 [Trichonephila inaurata madagascariensis]